MNSPTLWIGTGYFVPDGSRSQLRFRAKVIWENGSLKGIKRWKDKIFKEQDFDTHKKETPKGFFFVTIILFFSS